MTKYLSNGFCLLTLCASVLFPLPGNAERNSNRTRTIVLVSDCTYEEMEVFISYSPQPDYWRKDGWWRLSPGKRAIVTGNGHDLYHRDNAAIYYYAESPASGVRVDGYHGMNFDGEHFEGGEAKRLFRGNYVEVHVGWKGC
ncbi:DUF1036 domain-containing protein [Celeribacter neptunius]|uniref:Uncharacterized protein n=1 Tax=Celeribacter neptunius TaxID=588602 RepID=A0A1I3NXS4_9RHOB|nr:DUF1036 domain-containing protein [Celeribacter neptunius]SFJ14029.1 Protein of unknown function [Celeribacter neptunius]